MAYITIVQLSDRLGSSLYARLTDRVSGTTADATVAQQLVDAAEARADAWLSKRYATPIDLTKHSELVDVLESRVLDLAEYLTWRDSPFATDIPERARLVYEETSAWFGAVARGELVLPASMVPASQTGEG